MNIAPDAVPYPDAQDGNAIGAAGAAANGAVINRGSPVVPNSLVKHVSDAEGTVYTVMILRKFSDEFAKQCKVLRCQVREFEYDESAQEERLQGVADTEAEYNLALRSLYQWCKVHFGEIISTWVHIKVAYFITVRIHLSPS